MAPRDPVKRGRLVLTRREGEGMTIGDWTVVVEKIRGRSDVRLVILAPLGVPVVRLELVGEEPR
jgi:sRNA-binding carbon storage regulator CsrA